MDYNNPTFRYSNIPRSGFTLIEIMLVVVIILIIAGAAVPMFSGTTDSTRMKDAVRSTVRTARYARSMAILHQEDCTLAFATNKISLTSSGGTLAEHRIADTIRIEDFENLTEEAGENRTVLYYASGMNDGFELTLADDDGRRHTITCNPVTGKVMVEDD